MNFEGRVQLAERAGFPPGEAKEDWAILRALSDVLGKRLPYDNVEALRAAIVADAPHFARCRHGAGAAGRRSGDLERDRRGGRGGHSRAARLSPITDFYLTNPIARASETMAECSRLFVAARPKMAAE